jgi:hypothetical protein
VDATAAVSSWERRMRVYPDMNIRFLEDKESELIDAMRSRARQPWRT